MKLIEFLKEKSVEEIAEKIASKLNNPYSGLTMDSVWAGFDYDKLNPVVLTCPEFDIDYGCCNWGDCPKYNLKEECKKAVISWLNTEIEEEP